MLLPPSGRVYSRAAVGATTIRCVSPSSRYSEVETDPTAIRRRFPGDFSWGVAASAYQIEGAVTEDGRGPSIWDTFSRVPGAIANGDTGDVACDHYHRYPEDVRLMAEIGVSAYRFSVSWPRIMPSGTGKANARGLDFYRRLVDELRAAGVEPLINLFHWDLPQALQDRGGFANPEIVAQFADYSHVVALALADSVADWMTFNEPGVFAFLAHADGIHAPGLRHWPTAIRVADNQLRAHALASEAVRAAVSGARIGVAVDVNHFVPATGSERDRRAAEEYRVTRDTWFLDPLFGRGYPAAGVAAHDAAGHLEGVELSAPPDGRLDYLGLNYYRQETIHADSDEPFDWHVAPPRGAELTEMEWEVVPEGLYEALTWLHREYAPREIVISENGAAYPDPVAADGVVHDQDRLRYLARHLHAAADALDEGVPLSGYFVWSLLDNFEWSLGYGKRFGMVHVDFETQRRTLKDSGRWYQSLVRSGR
ncbi:GH1 family beta-glucosidase [soil metagenome]